MKIIYIIVVIACCQAALMAQKSWDEIIAMKVPDNLAMSASLYQIGSLAESNESNAKRQAELMAMIFDSTNEKIKVEVVRGWDTKLVIDEEELNRLPLDVHLTWKNRASCWIEISQLLSAATNLPDGYLLLAVHNDTEDNQGQGLQNSQSYIDNGKDGSGIKIAIIDSGFNNISSYQNLGVIPASVTQHDWTGNGIGGGIHGTACLEVVYDNAPGATYYVHKVSNPAETGSAVDQAIDDGVDIISHSQSEYNLGWSDNSGGACDAVSDAIDAGMLFFTSAGNRNGEHWQGNLSDGDGNDWHAWSGTDEGNSFTVGAGVRIALRMQWNASPDPIADDYDLYLYRSNGTFITSSASAWTFEELVWTNTSSLAVNVYFSVKQDGTDNNEFEVFNHPNGASSDFEHVSNSGSTTSPSNSTEPNCISVGAVPRGNYGQQVGSNVIAGYSSLGPTNGGSQAPGLSAVTNSTTVSYNGDFTGTSCSTPNAAGAAAAFWSAHPNYSATGIRQILIRKAKLFNDWGTSGTDMTYGSGGLFLKDYSSNTRYIYEFSGNNSGTSSLPYSSFQQADQYAPSGFTLYGLAHTHTLPAGGLLLDKPMVYKSTEKKTIVE